jgi:hypothetical protein
VSFALCHRIFQAPAAYAEYATSVSNNPQDNAPDTGPNVPAASTCDVKDLISAAYPTLAGSPSGDQSRLACTIGLMLMERDVADIEFPKRPPMLDEILRRSLTNDYGSEREGAEQVPYASSDDGAGNGFDMNNDYEVAMNSGTNINLRRLQEELDRQPLDEIAMLVRALTYGEMIELAEGMWKVQPDGSAVTQENLPALLHRWSQSRTVPVADYTHQQDSDAE